MSDTPNDSCQSSRLNARGRTYYLADQDDLHDLTGTRLRLSCTVYTCFINHHRKEDQLHRELSNERLEEYN